MVDGQYSDSTCSEACWYAKEDVCKCMCGGANHGLYKRDPNAEQPERTMRIKSRRYTLYAVSSRFDAYNIERAFYKYIHTDESFSHLKWWDHPAGDVISRRANETQILKWPEVKPFFTRLQQLKDAGVTLAMGDVTPYLIWIRTELTSEWLDAHPLDFKPYEVVNADNSAVLNS